MSTMFSEEKIIHEKVKKHIAGDAIPLFLYAGVYNYGMVNSQLTTLRSYLEAKGLEKKILRRIYSTLIEAIENVNKHSFAFATKNQSVLNHAYAVLLFNDEVFTLKIGNFINNIEIPIIKSAIDGTILVGEDELRETHGYKLINNKISEKQGIGIGIIDMALMSKSPIKYEISSYKEDISFLDLEIVFNSK